MTDRTRIARWLALTVAVSAGAACSGDGTVLEPAERLAPRATIVDADDPFDDADNQKAFVCVVSPVGGTYTFGITGVTGGTIAPTIPSPSVNVAPGTCVVVATAGDAIFSNPDQITADETAHPGGAVLSGVTVENALYNNQAGGGLVGGQPAPVAATDPATGLIALERATRITFYYDVAPPPPGGEGCTPGYWKQSQHFDSWVGYTPGQAFSSVFENAFPGLSLVDVLGQGGGGLKALGRHTVAALLNAANPNVNSGLTPQNVIDAFNAVFPGGDYEGLKNVFEALNELGCPLN